MAAATPSPTQLSFSFAKPHRSPLVRLANAVGRRFERTARHLVPLSADAWIRAAEARTGLSATSEAPLRESLDPLVESLEIDARLNAVGRWAVRAQFIDLLCQRLRVEDYLARHPRVREVSVERPIFIIGFPRSGTTFLHNMMALAPATRVPRFWEVLNPVPLGDSGNSSEDLRISEARKYLRLIDRMAPVALKIHPMTAEGPEEDRFLVERTLLGAQFMAYFRIPTYVDWFLGLADERLAAACIEVRRQMQIIKQGAEAQRWIGKSTGHWLFGRSLLQAFPDACVVHVLRDPVEAVPSICSLVGAYRSMFSDEVSPADLGPEALGMFVLALERFRQMRSMPPPAAFCDVRYEQLVRDPIAVVRRIYEQANMDFSTEVEHCVARYVYDHPQHAAGVHRYSAAQFGLTEEEIRNATEEHASWLEGFGH